MVRYKLIKEYPGSPKLNTIVENHENLNSAHTLDKYNYYNGMQIDKFPEFWEKVVEKDYEILSLIEDKFIYPCDKYDKDFINQLFNTLGVSIHSVKRNDGEIITIGDKVIGYNNSIAKIKTIDLVGEVSLNIGTDKHEGFSLKNLKKVKQPLFTTEDSVDIFEGDNLYSIDNMLNIRKHLLFNARYDDNTLLNNRIFFNSDYKHFSTLEKAEEFIAKNRKPLFTTEDGVDIFENIIYYGMNKGDLIMMKLNSKDIILDDNRCVTFSTKEKAEEYILLNKPCLSINDIINSKAILDTFGKLELEKLVQQKLNK